MWFNGRAHKKTLPLRTEKSRKPRAAPTPHREAHRQDQPLPLLGVDADFGPFHQLKPNSERTLKMARLSALTETNLNNQGFGKLDKDTKSRFALPLRFTPAVGTTLIVIGLIFQSPMWLGSMALVALSGALLPGAMIIDLVYNFGVRHLFRAPPPPSTPSRDSFPTFFPLPCCRVPPFPSITDSRCLV